MVIPGKTLIGAAWVTYGLGVCASERGRQFAFPSRSRSARERNWLEKHLQGELQNARIERGLRLSVGRITQVRDHRGEARLPGRRNRAHEVRVIENIESFHPGLQRVPLRKLKDPAHSYVEV